MNIVIVLLCSVAVGLIAYLSNDPFFIAGGSDANEQIIQISQQIRFAAAGAAILALLLLIVRNNTATLLLALICIVLFVLAHNTVRVSGKSFEVVQTIAMIPITRIAVVEGERDDLIEEIFKGIGPLSLHDEELAKAMSGLQRAE